MLCMSSSSKSSETAQLVDVVGVVKYFYLGKGFLAEVVQALGG